MVFGSPFGCGAAQMDHLSRLHLMEGFGALQIWKAAAGKFNLLHLQ
jgi:hypothetical protein